MVGEKSDKWGSRLDKKVAKWDMGEEGAQKTLFCEWSTFWKAPYVVLETTTGKNNPMGVLITIS